MRIAAIGDDLAFCDIDLPVLIAFGVPNDLQGAEFRLRQLAFNGRIEIGFAAAPTRQILAIEERRESGGRLIERPILCRRDD